jgi:hypothetical protein
MDDNIVLIVVNAESNDRLVINFFASNINVLIC